jgi:DNA-binding Lrp family transcriptional regulator
MLTIKEKKVLRMILFAFDADYSINQIAKECKIAPNGALKILNKFKNEGILTIRDIANIKSYKINFEDEKAELILELALMQDLDNKIKNRLDDLKEMKGIADSSIIFGSYLTSKDPDDLDILFILKKENYKNYKESLKNIKDIMPIKIHDIAQTKEDIEKNIIRKDLIVLDAIKKGIILWGQRTIIGVIKNVYKR